MMADPTQDEQVLDVAYRRLEGLGDTAVEVWTSLAAAGRPALAVALPPPYACRCPLAVYAASVVGRPVWVSCTHLQVGTQPDAPDRLLPTGCRGFIAWWDSIADDKRPDWPTPLADASGGVS